jgi:hypothetical protein
MHWISYYMSLLHSRLVYGLMIAYGILSLFLAARAEHTGVTYTSNGSRNRRSYMVTRALNPDLFRREVGTKWLMGGLWFAAGIFVRGIHQRANRSDPFSEDFAGTASLKELEEVLDKEIEERNRPARK